MGNGAKSGLRRRSVRKRTRALKDGETKKEKNDRYIRPGHVVFAERAVRHGAGNDPGNIWP